MHPSNTHYSHPAREDQPTPPRRQRGFRSILPTLTVIISAVLIAVLIVSFVFRPYIVDGPSMEPTLHHGDRLIIWKVPRTWARITGNDYVPNRGDIIVFVERSLVGSNGNNEQLIKRVIGVPGDRVVIEDGTVTIYNTEHPEGFQPDTSMPYGEGIDLTVNENEAVDMNIGEGEVYVMGDNRNNSRDSRMFGPVAAEDIVGKLVLRLFPISDAEVF